MRSVLNHISSFMLKMMGLFFPDMFRKQNQSFLDSFKAFAEEGRDVREGGGQLPAL